MEQTPTSPGRSPELPSVMPRSIGESADIFTNHEKKIADQSEHREQQAGRASANGQSTAPIVTLPPLTNLQVSDDAGTTAASITSSPTVANDDDLIEKEWVDKAKKVIAETKDDPYRREKEVGLLQADYLAKRYGRELESLQ